MTLMSAIRRYFDLVDRWDYDSRTYTHEELRIVGHPPCPTSTIGQQAAVEEPELYERLCSLHRQAVRAARADGY